MVVAIIEQKLMVVQLLLRNIPKLLGMLCSDSINTSCSKYRSITALSVALSIAFFTVLSRRLESFQLTVVVVN